jgi:hypothetical protein
MLNEKGDLSAGGMIIVGALRLAFSIYGIRTTPSIEPEAMEPRVGFMLTLIDAEIPGPQSVMVDGVYQLQILNEIDWEKPTADLIVRTASVIICEALPGAMLLARQEDRDIQKNPITGLTINGFNVALEEPLNPESVDDACDSDHQDSDRHTLTFTYDLPSS